MSTTKTGTQKQADTLVALFNRARRSNHEAVLTQEQEARLRAKVLEADLPTVRKMFDEVNAVLGFDRKRSRATSEQLKLLRALEVRRYGRALTGWRDGLSFEEAHKRIDSIGAHK
jgi:ribonuclease D